MSGQPRKRALVAALERRTRETFEDADAPPDLQATHLDYVCAWVEAGRTLRALAARISTEAGQDILPSMLSHYLRANFEGAGQRLEDAREIGAHAMLDETLEISDEDVLSSEDAARARNRIGARQYVAGAWNQATRASGKGGVTVNIAAGELMLGALRSRALNSNVSSFEDTRARQVLPSATISATAPNALTLPGVAQPIDPTQVSDLL